MKPKRNLELLFSSTLIFLLAAGCAHQWSEPSANSSSNPPGLQPTSDSAAQRVYSTTVTEPGGGQATLTKAPPNTSAEDRDIAQTFRKMMLEDKSLAPYPSKVAASMDPNSKGTVILTGWVPTQGAKRKLHERVAALPGVTRVEDKLEVRLAPKPEEFVPSPNP